VSLLLINTLYHRIRFRINSETAEHLNINLTGLLDSILQRLGRIGPKGKEKEEEATVLSTMFENL
jgi:hypothetical protein